MVLSIDVVNVVPAGRVKIGGTSSADRHTSLGAYDIRAVQMTVHDDIEMYIRSIDELLQLAIVGQPMAWSIPSAIVAEQAVMQRQNNELGRERRVRQHVAECFELIGSGPSGGMDQIRWSTHINGNKCHMC